jgi:hypothetical protein
VTSTQRSNFRPTARRTPTSTKPSAECSVTDASPALMTAIIWRLPNASQRAISASISARATPRRRAQGAT